MMSQCFRRRYFVAALGITMATVFLTGVVNADETIAWWRFDSANPWADSSGNGYDLMSMATSVAEDFDGAGTESQGSAYFNGTDSWAVTYNAVDLTSYDAIRLSWWMKVDGDNVGILFEQSANYNTGGGFITTVNEHEGGIGVSGVNMGIGGVHGELMPPKTGEWEQCAVEYWPGANNLESVLKVYRNGVLQEDTPIREGVLHSMGRQNSFISDMIYIGARASSSLFYNGYVDEVKLESFTPDYPEEADTSTVLVPLTNVIAEWTFDDAGNPWADSSGNGHDLNNLGGVTQSSNTMSGTGSSAYFDNSETAKLKTIETLDLTSCRHIQVSWSQLVTSDEVDILFEHSANATGGGNMGGFHASVNELGSGSGRVSMTNGELNNFNLTSYPHGDGAENTTWEEMVLDINLDAESNAMVSTLFRDGVVVSTYYYDCPGNLVTYGSAPLAFLNDYFNIGGRDGTAGLNFTGYVDNFTIATEGGGTWDIAGDANKDGKVDGSDVTILAGNWQVLENATWDMGDFNGDGKVDGSDVTILAGNWQYGVTAEAASVPEPSIIALLLGVLVSLAIIRQSK